MEVWDPLRRGHRATYHSLKPRRRAVRYTESYYPMPQRLDFHAAFPVAPAILRRRNGHGDICSRCCGVLCSRVNLCHSLRVSQIDTRSSDARSGHSPRPRAHAHARLKGSADDFLGIGGLFGRHVGLSPRRLASST